MDFKHIITTDTAIDADLFEKIVSSIPDNDRRNQRYTSYYLSINLDGCTISVSGSYIFWDNSLKLVPQISNELAAAGHAVTITWDGKDSKPEPRDAWGVVGNHRDGEKIIAKGAQCWIDYFNGGSGCDRNPMYLRSRSGRWIRKYVRADWIKDWRVKWIPVHLRPFVQCYTDKAEAEQEAARMKQQWEIKEAA